MAVFPFASTGYWKWNWRALEHAPSYYLAMPNIRSVNTAFTGAIFSVDVLSITTAHGEDATRDVVRHAGAVAVVPRLDDGSLVLVRNYRIAVDDWLLELPAGGIDPGESPIDAARRELSEETGYRAGHLESIGSFYTTPGYSDEHMHVVLAEDLMPGPQKLDPGEELDVEIHSEHDLSMMIRDGRVVNAVTIAAMHQFRLVHPTPIESRSP